MTKLAPNNYKTPKTRFLPPTLKLDTQKENLRRIKRGEEEKKKKKKKKENLFIEVKHLNILKKRCSSKNKNNTLNLNIRKGRNMEYDYFKNSNKQPQLE